MESKELIHAILSQFELRGDTVIRKRGNRVTVGTARGCGQYRVVRVTTAPSVSFSVRFHRLKFILKEGYAPPMVDHKNADKGDDSSSNLRAASRSQNAYNSRPYRKPSPHLPRGVRPIRRRGAPRWTAMVRLRGKNVYLGSHDSVEAASAAVETFLQEEHGEFYRPQTQRKPDSHEWP